MICDCEYTSPSELLFKDRLWESEVLKVLVCLDQDTVLVLSLRWSTLIKCDKMSQTLFIFLTGFFLHLCELGMCCSDLCSCLWNPCSVGQAADVCIWQTRRPKNHKSTFCFSPPPPATSYHPASSCGTCSVFVALLRRKFEKEELRPSAGSPKDRNWAVMLR